LTFFHIFCKGTNKFLKKILAVPKKFLPLQSRLTKAGFFDQIFENTERLKVQASTEKSRKIVTDFTLNERQFL